MSLSSYRNAPVYDSAQHSENFAPNIRHIGFRMCTNLTIDLRGIISQLYIPVVVYFVRLHLQGRHSQCVTCARALARFALAPWRYDAIGAAK